MSSFSDHLEQHVSEAEKSGLDKWWELIMDLEKKSRGKVEKWGLNNYELLLPSTKS